MGISFYSFAAETQKTASRRWRKAIETGEIGAREVETLLQHQFGSTHLPWRMRPPVLPSGRPVPVPNVLERYSPYKRGEMVLESLAKRPVSTRNEALGARGIIDEAVRSMKQDTKGGSLLDGYQEEMQAMRAEKAAKTAEHDAAVRKHNATILAEMDKDDRKIEQLNRRLSGIKSVRNSAGGAPSATQAGGGGVNPALVAGGIVAGALALGGGGLAVHHLMKQRQTQQGR